MKSVHQFQYPMSLGNHYIMLRVWSILAILPAVFAVQAQDLLKGPYLIYPGNNSRMQIMWQTTGGGMDTVKWGTDPTCSMGKVGSPKCTVDYLHKYTIKGLTPGTKYYYQVVIGGNTYTGSFRAAPPLDQTSLNFFAMGDIRTDMVAHNHVANRVNEAWQLDSENQTFVLCAGDLVTDGDQESYWSQEIFSLGYPGIREMHANLPFMSARGNHESSGKLFAKYFPYPFAGSYYYSFDYGPAHFTMIDNYNYFYPGSEQYEWIRNDLENSGKPWKFICLHEPAWSAGGGHGNNTDVQSYIEPFCEQYDVAILFAGHNHYYARAEVRGANGSKVVHITTGGGGAPLHSPDPSKPNVVAVSKHYQFCRISIMDELQIQCTVITDKGETVDEFMITK